MIDRGNLVYLGKLFEEAQEKAKDNNKTLRIVGIDEVELVYSKEIKPDRINVVVDSKNIIKKIIGNF